MIDEYSIERKASMIFDSRTKEYFQEILGCYISGNYRSAVVMLWSVSICDLIFKLQSLIDLHNDETAKTIIEEIGRLQGENERSPAWEARLVDLVSERTQLFDIAERENLFHLQRQRHLAAHPIISSHYELHRPNRDMARALIRNTLDGLLTKAPIFTKKIVSELVEDLAQNSEILIDDQKLKIYLNSKYFSRFNNEIDKAVFRALWKFVFKSTDEPCERNRAINFRALLCLFSRNKLFFEDVIGVETDYFSAIATSGAPLKCLVKFLSKESQIYSKLADHAKTVIEHISATDSFAKCLSWFTSENLMAHGARLNEWIAGPLSPQISDDIWRELINISDGPEWHQGVYILANSYYAASSDYDTANDRFDKIIRPWLANYDINSCTDLINRVEGNSQTRDRRRAYSDHRQVRFRVQELNPDFNFDEYPVFNRGLD